MTVTLLSPELRRVLDDLARRLGILERRTRPAAAATGGTLLNSNIVVSGIVNISPFHDQPVSLTTTVQSEGSDLSFAAGADATLVNCHTTGLYAARQQVYWNVASGDKDIRASYLLYWGDSVPDTIAWESYSSFVLPTTGAVTPQFQPTTNGMAVWRAEAGSGWKVVVRSGEPTSTASGCLVVLSVYRIL